MESDSIFCLPCNICRKWSRLRGHRSHPIWELICTLWCITQSAHHEYFSSSFCTLALSLYLFISCLVLLFFFMSVYQMYRFDWRVSFYSFYSFCSFLFSFCEFFVLLFFVDFLFFSFSLFCIYKGKSIFQDWKRLGGSKEYWLACTFF